MKMPDGQVLLFKADGLTINAEAKELVLCKDCKYSYTMITAKAKDGQERWTRFCDKHKTLFPKDDWFCKDGERKEE